MIAVSRISNNRLSTGIKVHVLRNTQPCLGVETDTRGSCIKRNYNPGQKSWDTTFFSSGHTAHLREKCIDVYPLPLTILSIWQEFYLQVNIVLGERGGGDS